MNDIHTDTSLRGIEPGTELAVSDERRENGLQYISKSRIKTYLQCPFKFFLKYWCEHRPPSTEATVRGSEIHECFEQFHLNLLDYIKEHEQMPDRFSPLMPDDYRLTDRYLDYIGSFWEFELRRWQEAKEHIDNHISELLTFPLVDKRDIAIASWHPKGIETEFWLGNPPEDYDGNPDFVDPEGAPVGEAPWMGKADLVAPTPSLPGLEGGGVTIVDYKTGSCPLVKYKGAPFLDEVMENVFIETEFYGWMAENHFDVDAIAIYYPKNDRLVSGQFGVQERRFKIKQAVLEMQEQPRERDKDGVPENFDFEPQNLCHWDTGKCWFYDICPSAEGK